MIKARAQPIPLGSVIPRKLWTRDEAHTLVELGFPDAEKLELIEKLAARMASYKLWI